MYDSYRIDDAVEERMEPNAQRRYDPDTGSFALIFLADI